MFGPSSGRNRLLCPRLTSANPSHNLSIMVVRRLPDRLTDLPGYCALTFTLMSATYTYMLSGQILDFEDICLLIRHVCLVCDFCSSNQRFACGFLQIPSRGGHPCRPANSSLCRVCKGLTPSSKCALPGAQKKEAVRMGQPLLTRIYRLLFHQDHFFDCGSGGSIHFQQIDAGGQVSAVEGEFVTAGIHHS